jgi:transposase-like protein
MTNDELLAKYVPLIEPLLPLAKKAYGSRDLDTPQHRASRTYTELLCEFYEEGGSLLDLGERLGVTYAGMRRRIITASVKPERGRARPKFSDQEYANITAAILEDKTKGTDEYHNALYFAYQDGYSMARIAQEMGLSSANPLYYGVNKIKAEKQADGIEPRRS